MYDLETQPMTASEYRHLTEMPSHPALSPTYLDYQDDVYSEITAEFGSAPRRKDVPLSVILRILKKYPMGERNYRNPRDISAIHPTALKIVRRYYSLFVKEA